MCILLFASLIINADTNAPAVVTIISSYENGLFSYLSDTSFAIPAAVPVINADQNAAFGV